MSELTWKRICYVLLVTGFCAMVAWGLTGILGDEVLLIGIAFGFILGIVKASDMDEYDLKDF